eukprot:CAMPEP_0172299254 /NCGR_PEP_ID=MMETSP1058-20130122/1611_1 /TAXON_ID=83371 /ORGANISM="Detonula confervacea, Strain CCMP 353" /LENGTH=98 /DNA_ID=CAMNT_0013008647 /DNA_START=293 /DNA_END=589 /DNA_ORIENTATION=-
MTEFIRSVRGRAASTKQAPATGEGADVDDEYDHASHQKIGEHLLSHQDPRPYNAKGNPPRPKHASETRHASTSQAGAHNNPTAALRPLLKQERGHIIN